MDCGEVDTELEDLAEMEAEAEKDSNDGNDDAAGAAAKADVEEVDVDCLKQMLIEMSEERSLHTLSNGALKEACRQLQLPVSFRRKEDLLQRIEGWVASAGVEASQSDASKTTAGRDVPDVEEVKPKPKPPKFEMGAFSTPSRLTGAEAGSMEHPAYRAHLLARWDRITQSARRQAARGCSPDVESPNADASPVPTNVAVPDAEASAKDHGSVTQRPSSPVSPVDALPPRPTPPTDLPPCPVPVGAGASQAGPKLKGGAWVMDKTEYEEGEEQQQVSGGPRLRCADGQEGGGDGSAGMGVTPRGRGGIL